MTTKYNEDHQHEIGSVIFRAEAWLQGAGFRLLTQEQHDALDDPTRAAEALGMLQDLRDRIGLPSKFVAPLAPIYAAAMRDAVEFAGNNLHALLDLQFDWIGHDECDSDDQPEDIARRLRAWIDEQVTA